MSSTKKRWTVIYVRFSDENQRRDSCADQERECRHHLRQMGLDTQDVLVISDEAVSGKRDDREGFLRLRQMMERGEIDVLVVDDQSRFSRGLNAKALVQDLVYHGGRFISVNEGTDTARPGWEETVGFAELRHSMSSTDTGRRIRRGQCGRVLDGNGSLGDFPFGYKSQFAENNWQEQVERGQRPKKEVVIDEAQAEIVQWVFQAYRDGWSCRGITRELNHRKVPKGMKSRRSNWYTAAISKMLDNEKYIGKWRWGVTESVRDSRGKLRQRPATRNDPVEVDRPSLRIINDDLWEAVRNKRSESSRRHHWGKGRYHPKHEFPAFNFGGIVTCGDCGHKLRSFQHRKWGRFFFCDQHRQGVCTFHRQVNVEHVERALLTLISQIVTQYPDWLSAVQAEAHAAVQGLNRTIPRRLEADQQQLATVKKKITKIVDQLVDSDLKIKSVQERLTALEQESYRLSQRIDEQAGLLQDQVDLPDVEWLGTRLNALPSILAQPDPATAGVLQRIIATADLYEDRTKGIKRGELRLRVRLRPTELMAFAWGDASQRKVGPLLDLRQRDEAAPELDVRVSPSSLTEERWALIEPLLAEGLTTREIGMRLNLKQYQVANTIAKWRQWNHLKPTRTPLWEQHGAAIDALVQKGLKWGEIGSQLSLQAIKAMSYHQRWCKKTGRESGLPADCDRLGPRIHACRKERMSYSAIGEEIGRSIQAVVALYGRWCERSGYQQIRCRPLSKFERLGPQIEQLRQDGLTWKQVGERLDMKWSTAASAYYKWKRQCRAESD